jgi:molybdopterin converting factor small subunit
VLFFAGAREAAGERRAVFEDAAGLTVAQLVHRALSRYGPSLEAVVPTCAIWVNGSPSPPGTVLAAGDEVAILPPVSGGCTCGTLEIDDRTQSRRGL